MQLGGGPREGPPAGQRRPEAPCAHRVPGRAAGRQERSDCRRTRPPSTAAEKGFHQSRLALDAAAGAKAPRRRLTISVREADADEELAAAAHLRAVSFYAYPPERAFAGRIHQEQMRDEEIVALRRLRLSRTLELEENMKSATLAAVCPLAELPEAPKGLRIRLPDAERLALLGSLDMVVVRALPGEVLIANTENAAYLANVCVAEEARRQGVGSALLEAARGIARGWGADGLFVHMMAVNEVGRAFYERAGFALWKEESSNDAHYRGRCLDGVEGRGRTLLLRDTRL